jgi:hypothetical protein
MTPEQLALFQPAIQQATSQLPPARPPIMAASFAVCGSANNPCPGAAATTSTMTVSTLVPAVAWYTTWWGMGLIGLAGYLAYKNLIAAPAKPSA